MQKQNLGVTMKFKYMTALQWTFSPVEPVEALVTVRLLVLFLEGSLVELQQDCNKDFKIINCHR